VAFAYPDDGQVVLDGVDLDVPPDTTLGLVGRTGSGKTTLARLAGFVAGLPEGLDTVVGPDAGLSGGQAQLIGIGRALLRDPGLVVLDEASSRVDPVTAELVEAALDRLLAGRTVIVIAHRLRAVDRADVVAVLESGRVVEVGPRGHARRRPVEPVPPAGGPRGRARMTRRTAPPGHRRPRAGRVALGLARRWPGRYLAGSMLWAGWWVVPVLLGLLLKATFDAIGGASPAGLDVASLIALVVAVEGMRLAVFVGAFVVWSRWWARAHTLLRTNLLAAQVASGGPAAGAPVRASGEVIAVFRDDATDVVEYTDGWVDLAGTAVFGLIAVAVMLRVDALLTLVVVVPLVAAFGVTGLLAERIRRVRRADRKATARVTGLLGGLFSAVLAVKVAGAEDQAVRRLRSLNRDRLRTSLRDRVLTQTLDAFNGSTVDLTIGLVLLLVAPRMRTGAFTVGDLALFASYLTWLASLPRWAGLVLTRHRHAEVAAGRMAELLPNGDEAAAVAPRRLRIDQPPPPAPRPPRPSRRPGARAPAAPDVELRGFGVRGRLGGVDLRLAPGSFTVVTGPVGAGKSTLLRGLLGLTGPVEGTVVADGVVVTDLAAHFVPPRCAFVPQAPRLFSATLRDNLALGRAVDDAAVEAALRTAALDEDVAAMPDGLDTLVGPRGVRLSGGQLQRAATARALVAGAPMLLLDDLSSAVDAPTELQLWRRLVDSAGGNRPTVLVVSHRAAAIERADQVVRLDAGRVVAVETTLVRR